MDNPPGTHSQITTIMFTDLVGSTERLEQLGDEAATAALRAHIEMLRAAIAEFGGSEMKILGDGLMVAFPSAVGALRCAIAMQRAMRDDGMGDGLRIGIDAGEPVNELDDLFGTPVVVARRLCDGSLGGQIRVTDLVCRLAGRRVSASFLPLGPVRLKGLSDPVDAVLVDWREEPAGPPPRLGGRPGADPGRPPRGRLLTRVGAPVVTSLAAAAIVVALTASGATHGRPSPTRPDGSVQVYQPPAGESAQHPCYLSSGEVLFSLFTNGYSGHGGSAYLYRVATDGTALRRVISHSGNSAVNLAGRCYDARSGRVVYSSDRYNTANIFTATAGAFNTGPHQVTCYRSPTLHAVEPTFSPDGELIAYSLNNDHAPGRATLWTVPASNDCSHPVAPTPLVPGPAACRRLPPADNHEPNWSPNGTAIVFQRQAGLPDGSINLWTTRPNGCGLRQLTSDQFQDTDPSWSPDSSRIVYSTDHGSPTGIANLFVVSVRSRAITRLTSQCFYDGEPSWSPDGMWVSYETWPTPNPGGNDVPTAVWRVPISAAAHPVPPKC